MSKELDEQLKFNLNVDGKGELVIRHGEAEEINYPIQEELEGTIIAPREFASIRGFVISDAIMSYSLENMMITYFADFRSKYGAQVKGQIVINPDLKAFYVNTQRMWQPKELASFLKLNRIYFQSREDCARIVTNLMDLKANTVIDNNQTYDNRGNIKLDKEKKVTTNVDLSFNLVMPIFTGGENKSFNVEICLDTTDVGVKVWFESVELAELMKTVVTELMKPEIDWFKTQGIVCIEE